jgi:exoribonuclease R
MFSAIFKLDNKGKVIEEWFGKTVSNSDHRFTYEGAQEVIDFNNDKANKDKLLIYNPRYNGQIR